MEMNVDKEDLGEWKSECG